MSFTRRSSMFLLLVSLFAFVCGAEASAQSLHDKWFKMKVTSSGFAIDPVTGDASKAKASQNFYMHFQFDESNDRYDYEVWTKGSDGQWTSTSSDSGSTYGNDDAIAIDWWLSIKLPGASAKLQGYLTGKFTLKRVGTELKSASFTTLGGEAIDSSSVDGTKDYFGSLIVKGTMVAVTKLPFPIM